MNRIVTLDPGTAGLGCITAESDGVDHRIIEADVFESVTEVAKYSYSQHDDRVRRTQELNRWLRPKLCPPGLDRDTPVVVVAEAMSFPPSPHAIAMMCLAWGVIVSLLEERRLYAEQYQATVPQLVEVHAAKWRTALVGHALLGKMRPTKNAMRGIVNERERAAQLEALRRYPIHDLLDRIPPELRVHVLDALGVFAWAVHDLEVKRLLSARR